MSLPDPNLSQLAQKPALERQPQPKILLRQDWQRLTPHSRKSGHRKVHLDHYPVPKSPPNPIERVPRPLPKWQARQRDLKRIVNSALAEYSEQAAWQKEAQEGTAIGVVRPLPRRKQSKRKPGPPPDVQIYKEQDFRVGVLATILRCLVWVRVFGMFFLGILWDRLLFRDSLARRAARLLRAFQSAGGSAVKIGQQLAMRIDLFPYEYCRELSKLLESVPPFSVNKAIWAIERATGKRLEETFLAFDPKPIGSASIACVYQAVLRNGQRVAVKVRRPNIGYVFATDIRAIRWVIRLGELLSLIRPGYLNDFANEFSFTIFEELDFRMEAYHQIVFARNARKAKRTIKGFNYLSAPAVYRELSNQEVLVQEFVSGIWMWEVLAAVENNDTEALMRMRQMNIDPVVIARQLMYIQYWGQFVSNIFHADPHPANIVVQEDNKLVFIDFGACGSMNLSKRRLCLDLLVAIGKKDVVGVVKTMLSFVEPMPPTDLNRITKELEIELGAYYRRLWSKVCPWYEKTAAALLFKLFGMLQKYDIPANLDTVRALRSNILYDTLAARVDPDLDVIKTIRDFLEDYGDGIRRDTLRSLRKQLNKGLINGINYVALKEVRELSSKVMTALERYLDRPFFAFNFRIDKGIFVVIEIFRLVAILGLTTGAICAFIASQQYRHGLTPHLAMILPKVLYHWAYQAPAGLMALITTRRIMLRLGDPDIE